MVETECKIARIGEDYITGMWPDESAALDSSSQAVDLYLNRIEKTLLTYSTPFRIGGYGCGPSGNSKFLRMIVDKLLQKKKDLQIEIMLIDLSCNELQLKELARVFPETNVFSFSSFNTFYNGGFPNNSMDIIFAFSCLSYPHPEWAPQSKYESLFYIHGINHNEEIESYSRSLWKKIITNINNNLKKGGLFMNIEFGVSDVINEEIQAIDKYLTAKGEYLHKFIKKYNLKKSGIPILSRNSEVMTEPMIKGQVPFEVLMTAQILDPFNLNIELATKTQEEKRNIYIKMALATEKPFILDESNMENVEKAWKEFEENFPNEFIENDSPNPGVLMAAMKI